MEESGSQGDALGYHVADPSGLKKADTSITEGLKIARDCGYGLYHIDLLLEEARLHLLTGNPQSALEDIELALDIGIPANDETGQPELLAANHKDCGYAWAIPAGLHLRGEALLLKAAQIIGKPTYKPRSRKTPAKAKELVKQAKSDLQKAMRRWKKFRDAEPEREDQNFVHPKTREEYNFRAAGTFQVHRTAGSDSGRRRSGHCRDGHRPGGSPGR